MIKPKSNEYGISEMLSHFYVSNSQEADTEESPQAPFLKGKKPSNLISHTGERQLSKKISGIADRLKIAPTKTTTSLLAQVQGLQHLQSESAQMASINKKKFETDSEVRARQFTENLFIGTQSVQDFSFGKPRLASFSAAESLSLEVSKKTTGFFHQAVEDRPLAFPSAPEINQCLENQLCRFSFGAYLKEKGMLSEMSLSFADKTYSDVNVLRDTINVTLSSINSNSMHLTPETLIGIGMHMEKGLLNCVQGSEGLANSQNKAANKKAVSVHIPVEKTTSSSFNFSDSTDHVYESAIEAQQLKMETFNALSLFQRRVRKVSEKLEEGTKIGKSVQESESPYRDGMVNTAVNAAALTAAGLITGPAGPTVLLGINQGAKFADHAMPSVDAFIEMFPVEDARRDFGLCSTGPEYCPPRYYGLAAKGILTAFQEASNGIDDALEAVAKPIKHGLENARVTDENARKVFNHAVKDVAETTKKINENTNRVLNTLAEKATERTKRQNAWILECNLHD